MYPGNVPECIRNVSDMYPCIWNVSGMYPFVSECIRLYPVVSEMHPSISIYIRGKGTNIYIYIFFFKKISLYTSNVGA